MRGDDMQVGSGPTHQVDQIGGAGDGVVQKKSQNGACRSVHDDALARRRWRGSILRDDLVANRPFNRSGVRPGLSPGAGRLGGGSDAAEWAIEMEWRGSAHPRAAIWVGDRGLAHAIGQGKRVFGFWVLGNHVALRSPLHLNSVVVE
jgi:hypothetical protein